MEKPVQMCNFIHNGGLVTVGKMYIIRHFPKGLFTGGVGPQGR